MSLPYFPLYPTDFEADTSHLTLAEDGAYNRLLRLMWMTTGCTLPDDNTWVKRRMRVDQETFDSVVMVVIAEFFQRKAGRIISPRLAKEYQKTDLAHKKRVAAGSKGGKAKAAGSIDKDPSKAEAMPKQPEPEPEPYKEEAKASLSLVPLNDPIPEAIQMFKEAAEKSGWPIPRVLSKARKSALSARLKECDGLDGWKVAIEKAQASPHCCGDNDRNWVLTFDFITNQSSFTKLMEGNYDNRDNNPARNVNAGAGAINAAARIRRAPEGNLF